MTTQIPQARCNWSICYLVWKVTASQLCLHLTGNLACLHYPKSFSSVASYTNTVLISTICSEAFSCNVLILTCDVCFVLNDMSGFVTVVCWQWVWKQSVTWKPMQLMKTRNYTIELCNKYVYILLTAFPIQSTKIAASENSTFGWRDLTIRNGCLT